MLFQFRTFMKAVRQHNNQTISTMKIQTENILAHTCVIGGCAALIGTVVFLFIMLSDYLKEVLSVASIG
ncbi:MAG: hypothetical protein EA341_11530 [Mongoliibacter sp.]|nr:MAG: hypothetical protein EA341_11530 [Mongoliibacter sp.]